jgi:hypothetical protein
MASLQARHSRSCATSKPWTTFADAKDGCTCAGGPSYYVVVRDGGKLHRERVGKNRKTAERALTKRQAEEDDGSFVPQKTIRFDEWADRWLASLERKKSTVDGYRSTTHYARQAFGDVIVRRLTVEHVKAFLRVCSDARRGKKGQRAMSESTRAKHLRVSVSALRAPSRPAMRAATRSVTCRTVSVRGGGDRKRRTSQTTSCRFSSSSSGSVA